jgi:DDE superfamily endonuclease
MTKDKCFNVFMPRLLKKGQKQFETVEANESRRVTMTRWVIESVNGRFKNKFRFFDSVIPNSYIPKLRTLLRIAIAIINKFSQPLFVDSEERNKLATEAMRRLNLPNVLQKKVIELQLVNKRAIWNTITTDNSKEFPHLSLEDLKFITLGSYQIKMSPFYSREHVDNGNYQYAHHIKDDGLLRIKI